MAQVRKRIAPPLVGSDIILVIRPGQNINQVLDCTYQELVNSLNASFTSASGFVPETRTLTINGVTYDLTQDRSWTVSGGGAVDSVNGQTGVVILALDDLSDVNAPSPTNGQVLTWNGTEWAPVTAGVAAWGSIATGTGVSSQADLVAYLAANYQIIGSYVLTTRTITINGVTQDLSANRTWTLTANNGVQQETGNPTNFEIGGSIIKPTLLNVGPSSSGHDLQFDSPGALGGSGKIKFTATTGSYTSTDKLVRFEADGAISAYFIARGTNGTGIYVQSISSGAVPMIISNASSTEILRMINSGQLQLNLYNTATAFQGSSGASVGVLNVDNTGKVFVGPGGGGGVTSVNSGININVDNTNPAAPIINSLSDRYKTTSTTSNSVSNGTKTFTVDLNLSYIPLQEILVVYDPANHMHGEVTSYNPATGVLVVDIKNHTGSGTYTSWTLNLDGTPVDAITGTGTVNEIAYFTAAKVINSLTTATYPSLTELSYVKGVGSAIQTQINGLKVGSFGVTVDGVTAVVQVGTVGYVVMPYAGTITGWSITANVSGSIQFDVWKATSAIPTVANTIISNAAFKPKLTSINFATSTTLTSWTTGFLAGDVFGFYVDSASTIKNATLTIRTIRT